MEDLKVIDNNVKSFRLNCQKIMLTYENIHLNKEKYIEWFGEHLFTPKFIRLAHEIGKETLVNHTHVLVWFGKPINYKDCRKFDITENDIVYHPNIKKVITKAHWDNAKMYLGKEDKDNEDLLTPIDSYNIVERIWECENIQDALRKNCDNKINNAVGIIQIFNMKKDEVDLSRHIIDDDKFYPWQKKGWPHMQTSLLEFSYCTGKWPLRAL